MPTWLYQSAGYQLEYMRSARWCRGIVHYEPKANVATALKDIRWNCTWHLAGIQSTWHPAAPWGHYRLFWLDSRSTAILTVPVCPLPARPLGHDKSVHLYQCDEYQGRGARLPCDWLEGQIDSTERCLQERTAKSLTEKLEADEYLNGNQTSASQ